MKPRKTLLKILIVVSYVLPFTFYFAACTSLLELEVAFNAKDASAIRLREHASHVAVDSLDNTIVSVPEITIDSSNLKIDQTIISDTTSVSVLEKRPGVLDNARKEISEVGSLLLFWIMMPRNEALSGFGVLAFYKSTVGKGLISFSMLLTILTFFSRVKFIGRNVVLIYCAIIICLLLFMIQAKFMIDVDLKWGIFITMGLASLALGMELKTRKGI